MLPVYKAYQFQKVIYKGGRTIPWVILVNDGNALVPYVVKMFKAELIHRKDSVTNEVLGHLLAKEFDLPVLNAAFIEMDDDFIRTINEPYALEAFDFVDDRVKFATQLINPFNEYQPGAYSSAEIRSLIDIDTVYAFDTLIRNADRTMNNPNMQMTGSDYHLIDHELGFQINDKTAEEMLSLKFVGNQIFRSHIFHNFLYSSWAKTQAQFFHTFEEYLKRLNLKMLDSAFSQLCYYGFSNDRHLIIRNYLETLKYNSSNFVKLMGYRILVK